MEYNRNFFIAIALSMLVMLGWQFFFAPPLPVDIPTTPAESAQGDNLQPGVVASGMDVALPDQALDQNFAGHGVPGSAGVMTGEARAALIRSGNRVRIETANMQGSINLHGALIDDLLLKKYRETVDKNSPLIALFNPVHDLIPLLRN